MPSKQNYLIARYSNNPDNRAVSANFGPAPDQELEQTEVKFQVSIKAKALHQSCRPNPTIGRQPPCKH